MWATGVLWIELSQSALTKRIGRVIGATCAFEARKAVIMCAACPILARHNRRATQCPQAAWNLLIMTAVYRRCSRQLASRCFELGGRAENRESQS